MSAPDVVRLSRPRASAPDGGAYGTIAIVGGGCYGSYYVRQLERARRAGAVDWRRLVVVDRDAGCRVASEGMAGAPGHAPAELVVAGWNDFFADWLRESCERPSGSRDAIVPSPLMPHLMFDWLLARARERWPSRRIERRPLPAAPGTPWERAAPDGTHYASYATWMCPVNCVEPEVCPHTRGARDWSMPRELAAWVERERAAGRAVEGPAVFHCAHRAFGVGMFDVADVVAADRLVERAGSAGASRVLVGTVSHCHGALALLELGG
jgi:hypothetical protein